MDISPFSPIPNDNAHAQERQVAEAFRGTLTEIDPGLAQYKPALGMDPTDDFSDSVAVLFPTTAKPLLDAAMAGDGPARLLAAAQKAAGVDYVSDAPQMVVGPGLPNGTYADLIAITAYVGTQSD